MSLRLTIHDSFEGVRVVNFTPATETTIDHKLNARQIQAQDLTKHIWDEETRRRLESDRLTTGAAGPLSQKETFPAIMVARLSPVHESCPTAGYGEAAEGQQDLVDGPGGLAEHVLEDLLIQMEEDSRDSKPDKSMKKAKERRATFRKGIQHKWESTRMLEMLAIVDRQKKRGKKGKYLIFSEFLCALDVAHAALESRGYKVLRYDGWQTASGKEIAVKRFQDDADDHEFLLVTNRSGGEGLNLHSATTVIHITPSWNPAMRRQLNGRAVRIGQDNDVDVFYFCVMDSMEGHITRLAEEKDMKASGLLDPTDETEDRILEASSWTMGEYKKVVSSTLSSNSSKC